MGCYSDIRVVRQNNEEEENSSEFFDRAFMLLDVGIARVGHPLPESLVNPNEQPSCPITTNPV
jgi:hypothetical protein